MLPFDVPSWRKVDDAWKAVAKTSTATPKAMQDEFGQGGDDSGNYILARATAGTKRKREEDDSEYDPLDELWSGPALIYAAKGKAGDADDRPPTQRRSGGGGAAAKPDGVPPPQATTSGGTSAERKKQIAAEQAARPAILDGCSMIAKLEDEQLVFSITAQQLAACRKRWRLPATPTRCG